MGTFTVPEAGRQAKVVGEFAEMAWGVDLTASATVTITVPSMKILLGGIAGGNTSATAPFIDIPAGVGNQFRITKADSDVVTWMVFGIPRL